MSQEQPTPDETRPAAAQSRAEEVLRASSSQAADQRKKKVIRELAIIIALSILVFVVGWSSGIFDWAFQHLDSYDSGTGGPWDEAVGTLLFVSLALMVFSYRRWQESQQETLSQMQISQDRKSTRLNSSHFQVSRMPSSA